MVARNSIRLCSLLFSLWAISVGGAEPSFSPVSFDISDAPEWVQRYSAPPSSPEAELISEGIAYLLVDRQENLEPRAFYYHNARQITSENGLQSGAAISVSFDPSYQKLIFHFIRLTRNGVAADRLDRSQIKLFQREREMESFLYDGSYTAHCQLEDVRVGDVIEYACTIEGANPVLGGKYFTTFATNWNIPVRRAIQRIVYPSDRKLSFLIKNRAVPPVSSTKGNATEWLWDETDVPAHRSDDNTPFGYNPYGFVQVSEFAGWQQVVDWAVPLYESDAPLSAELEEEIARIRNIPEPEQRILAALRFVQDEIRYLGIESGVGSHQPTAPAEVLRRRFGDCKDKTLLLATVLRHSGLAATPALVSTAFRKGVADRLPSPGAFNHVILQVDTGSSIHWLDATRSYQRGPLSQIYVGDFGYALLLRPGANALTAYQPPPDSLPRKDIVEKYRIPSPGGKAHLEVTTEFRGVSAEITRSFFRTNSKDDIQKNYLHYYARRYPLIQVAQPVSYEELPGEVGCRVTERYHITQIWQINDEETEHSLFLHPTDIDNEIGVPGAAQRSDPLALNHPVTVTQEIQVEMFEDWPLTASQRDIANPFFHFVHSSQAKGAALRMTYSYRSLVDQVSPNDLPIYDTAVRKLKDTLGYRFTYSTPEQVAARRKKNPHSGHGEFNWLIAIMLGGIVMASIAYSIRYYHVSKLPHSLLPPPAAPGSLEGIGGWLILVAIALCLRPVHFVIANLELYPSIFAVETWRSLTQSGQAAYHPFWMPILLFEITYNSIALVFCVLLLVLFFKKRAAWPRCYIAFFVFLIIGLGVDYWLALQIPATAAASSEGLKALIQAFFGAAIWIPYCLKSRRVQATFRH